MRNFKNLYVWQKSHEFVLEIITVEKYNDIDNKLSEIKKDAFSIN